MAYCSNCGEKNKNGNKFCSNCGEPLNSARSEPSKPIKSRLKSQESYSKSQPYTERPSKMENRYETPKVTFEWNIVIVGALILVIVAGILGRILPILAIVIAAAIAIIYALSATRKMATIVVIIPLIMVLAASIFALFSL
ncbi:MAG: zinc-ribbon domain-containing protein [Methanobacteriaceae archaeon]|nr:zinc-ribbon domain-containing protein [Methanobacteriaceae archaeon]MDO9627989.1 zinc-ribbon domain-containing protein [Methanobacteriaceae archaeon]